MRVTNLNGYWDRLRSLLRLLGNEDLPEQVTGVIIAGDSRESGNCFGSYRRFGLSESLGGPIGAGGAVMKWRADQAVVITSMDYSHVVAGATFPAARLRTMSVDQVVADVAATYAVVSTGRAGWRDRPDASVPPISFAANGSVGLGAVVASLNTPQNVLTKFDDLEIFLPAGSGLLLDFVTLSNITNVVVNLRGYVK